MIMINDNVLTILFPWLSDIYNNLYYKYEFEELIEEILNFQ